MRYVCIVDDSADYRFLLGYFLGKNLPDCAIELYDGAQALLNQMYDDQQNLEKGVPSLIILDLSMPGIDGYDLLRVLKQSADAASRGWDKIPVVINSSETDKNAQRKCYELGASTFLEKSADVASLQGLKDLLIQHMSN
jgi:CheY-like chemotaxis protein